MKPRVFIIIGATAALLAVGASSRAGEERAAAAPDGFNAKFHEMDKDGDGRISREEYENFILQDARIRFDKADKNGDGTVTRTEAQEAVKARAEEIREKMREWKERQERLRPEP